MMDKILTLIIKVCDWWGGVNEIQNNKKIDL